MMDRTLNFMDSTMKQYLRITVAVFISILCAWIWIQSQEISNLRAETKMQAQIITEQEKANKALQVNFAIERSAVEKQTILNHQYKSKSETKQESIRYVLKENQCANTAMPDAVIKQLQ